MCLFKEDVFPELGRAGGFLDQGGGSSGVIGVQRSQIFIEQGAFRRFFRGAPGCFPEEALRQRVVSLAEGQGSLLEDEAGGRSGIFEDKAFRVFHAVFVQQGGDGIQGKGLDGKALRIFGEAVLCHFDSSRQVVLCQKQASHGIHGCRLAGRIPGIHPAGEFFQRLGIGAEDVLLQQDVEGVHQQGGFRFAANERQQAFFRRSGSVWGFLFLRLGARFLFRLFRVVFLPDDFRPGEGQTAQIPDFPRIGLVVHDGGEDFYGLVQVPLFVGQFAFHEFGIRAHGQVPGRAVVHSRLELFKNGGGLRIAPQVHQNVRQKDVRGPGDGGGFRLPQLGEGIQ